MANLSKDWTLKSIIGLLRIFGDEIAPNKLTDLTLIDIIHAVICELAQMLGEANNTAYSTSQVVTQSSGLIDISSYKIDTILKLVDATNGLCVKASLDNIENIAGLEQHKNTVFWARNGQKIEIKKGSGVSDFGVLTLHYNRRPTKATVDSDYLDIEDSFFDLALSKAKIKVYEILDKAAPESLTNVVNNTIARVKEDQLREMATLKGSKAN